jgi:hypothetical protein
MLSHTWIKPWARFKCHSLCRELLVTSQAQHSVLCCSSIRYSLKFKVTCKTVLIDFGITHFFLCWHCTFIWALVPASQHIFLTQFPVNIHLLQILLPQSNHLWCNLLTPFKVIEEYFGPVLTLWHWILQICNMQCDAKNAKHSADYGEPCAAL